MIAHDYIRRQKIAANCPHCKCTHHFVEIRHPIENDIGHWIVGCRGCTRSFAVAVLNPDESGGAINRYIQSRAEQEFSGDTAMLATEIVRHNIDFNRTVSRYNYAGSPLYECELGGANLEEAAQAQLAKEFSGIVRAYGTAINNLLKGGSDPKFFVARVGLSCSCGEDHVATFCGKMDYSGRPLSEDRIVLADVSGSKLLDTLTGIVTKTEFMDILEKLVVRWNLLFDQIIVVSPFVGYAQMGADRKLSVWERILSILDPERAILLTRTSTWNEYAKAMEEAGVPTSLLKQFDLQNKIVATRHSKQGFHAKFYAGVGPERCELLSGSANLVDGPSVENIAFHEMAATRFFERYIKKLNLKAPLPAAHSKGRHWVLIEKRERGYVAIPKYDGPYLSY